MRHFCGRRAYIYFLEARAQIITSLCFSHLLADRPLHFVDNEAAKFALIKGYGSDLSINSLLTLFWSHQSMNGSDPWFERVSSKANISDAVSRDDMSEATQAGWKHLNIKLDNCWPILLRALSDQEFAANDAHKCLTAELRPQVDALLPGVDPCIAPYRPRPSGTVTE